MDASKKNMSNPGTAPIKRQGQTKGKFTGTDPMLKGWASNDPSADLSLK